MSYGYSNSTSASKGPDNDHAANTSDQKEKIYEIGVRGIRVKLSWFANKPRCDIRHYFLVDDVCGWVPTKKGTSLEISELVDLANVFDKVYETMDRQIREMSYGVVDENRLNMELFQPIGKRGIFVKVDAFGGVCRCHIRHYEMDEIMMTPLYPTKKGACLIYEEVVQFKRQIRDMLYELKQM